MSILSFLVSTSIFIGVVGGGGMGLVASAVIIEFKLVPMLLPWLLPALILGIEACRTRLAGANCNTSGLLLNEILLSGWRG